MAVPMCMQAGQSAGWPEYGGNLAGQRYSAAKEIHKQNVDRLQVAWTFHTHALDSQKSVANSSAAFEATPVLWKDTLYFDSPFDEVFAVDARTGKLKWKYDPEVARTHLYIVTSRGVALWHASRPHKGVCGSDVVLVATLDRRLIARDAATGAACAGFGDGGTVDLAKGVEIARPELYFFTSPPIVAGDTIVLGSSVGDNQQLFAASGAVRGFDAVTGRQKWSWEPVRWTANQHPKQSGSGNVWTLMAADAEHDLVFVPTSSPSLDYYGGTRIGDNRDVDSIVALRASTGERVWAFQLVHHDLWDYDVASQPLLFNFRGTVPAVAVTNKTGMIYVFNRLTGEPLHAIVERAVAQSKVPGERTWPTQPFSSLPPLIPLTYSAADLRGTETDKNSCRTAMEQLQYHGLFTPPSEQGSLIFPSALGGPNWGSSAFDPETGVMYTRVNALPFELQLIPKQVKRTVWERMERRWQSFIAAKPVTAPEQPSTQYHPPDLGLGSPDGSLMQGAPYRMQLKALVSPDGLPCGPAPYGRIVATNLNTGKQMWSVAHGELKPGVRGSVGVGGAIATAGGLLFAASTNDPYLYAYDVADGRVLWKGKLPATANATPMTFMAGGRQYVVIAVGGHRMGRSDESDTVVAFALPRGRR
ncbi:pyrroloquinoline quinone-dependent dehydrogenase [Granulicella sp. 5B5]|uniref:pyrroloquinoline quinone-dependent dehydrogenase n=1 Tax=Granulicella sp. 5B5 TaxID=1617967 RepID=UPI001C7117BC|nr:pyrroloquinoline quinone-dependent dehydrogenase [Granulicella sp. 5B5]